jgi:hypothetical protein
VTVKGHLYSVRQKGRTTYYRLVIGNPDSDFIETPEVRVPAAEPDPLAIAVGQVAAFSDEEAAAIPAAEEAEAAR